MARIRTIKPEFFESQKLGSLTIMARLTFTGLISLADDEGRGRAGIMFLIGRIHPYAQDVTPANLQLALEELVGAGLVGLYQAENCDYYHLPGWLEHQRIEKPRPSTLPEPPVNDPGGFPDSSPTPPRRVAVGMEGNGRGVEGKRKGREGKPLATVPAAKEKTDLQRIVEAYKHAKHIAMDDKGWDKANFGRYSKAGRSLLDCFKGVLDAAAAYLFVRGQEMDEKGLEWTLETIARQAWDGAGMKQEGSDESGNGKVDDGRTAGRLGSRGFTPSRALAGDALRAIQTSIVRSEKDGDLGVPDAID
jgi:hypothetical protein